MTLSDLIKKLQVIEKEGNGDALVAVDTEARCTEAHLYKVSGAYSPEPEACCEAVVITLEI